MGHVNHIFEYLKQPEHDRDYNLGIPFTPKDPQSEAIAELLHKLDTYIHRLNYPSDYDRLTEQQRVKRRARACLLEAGRHFLTAVQYLLVYLRYSKPGQEIVYTNDFPKSSQTAPSNVSCCTSVKCESCRVNTI